MHYKKLVFLLLPITVTKFRNNFNLGYEQNGAFTFKVVNSQASNSVIVTVRCNFLYGTLLIQGACTCLCHAGIVHVSTFISVLLQIYSQTIHCFCILQVCMSARYDPATKALNLSCLAKDQCKYRLYKHQRQLKVLHLYQYFLYKDCPSSLISQSVNLKAVGLNVLRIGFIEFQ